jgi:epoxyqueuosine reductase
LGETVARSAVNLSSRIREESRRLGFFNAGIAPARSLADGEHLLEWLRDGRHGTMHYLEREPVRRLDPRLILEDARSVLVLGFNYYAGDSIPDDPMKGRISRYAWGDDYHAVLVPRLEALLGFIKEQAPSARGRCYVDAGPIMEKAWGAQTSLGWVGKNTNLIARGRGSWFFLGVILLNLELEYDAKERDCCGKCRRCIDRCPTGAITGPYVIDARRCISYLTIELRGEIPLSLRPLMGNRIFGCDECQAVCPWNRFAAATSEPAFGSGREHSVLELSPLVQLTRDDFAARFRNSPIYRATRDGFVRNVVVALGNSRSREAVPALESALQDQSPLVRSHAAWALENIKR